MSSEYRALYERVDRLERENRRFRIAVIVGLLLIGALGVMGVGLGERVYHANAYTLTGPQGQPRAMLAMGPDEPMFVMYDPDGNARMWLGVVDNIPGIVLFDEKGNPVWKAPPAVSPQTQPATGSPDGQ